ncbi:type IV-A pilus assembly ATPase PilB [bacterium]|nr:type IV-A pilus assembly ATPase PilB [bacterium]
MNSGKLGALLVAKGLITQEQLQSAAHLQSKEKIRLGSSLVKLGHVNEKVLISFLSAQYGIPATSLEGQFVTPEILRLVPKSLCEKHVVLPLTIEENKLKIAMSDPTHVSAIDDVRFISSMEVSVVLATESEILAAVQKLYKQGPSVLGTANEYRDPAQEQTQTGVMVNPTSETIDSAKADSKPIIKLINNIFLEAIKRKVSDIHIEPYERFSRVRFRIDGSLHEMMKLPIQFRLPVPARIKVMANLDIAEKRLPQDGRIQIRTKDRSVDVRVSLVPTIHGEKVVMRLLDQGGSTPELTQIGMEPEQLQLFQRAAELPYGMILVTGPTGSGKTTTLYAALSSLNTTDVNLSTAEDPVEYTLLGINQVHVKESIGMTFAGALRSFLRQDPDIIMVGEIRDQETAEISVKAALTGHMVFSTLHTNDATSTISRLRHMGLEPFLITAAVTLVQAQRLVRMLCPHCKEPDPAVTDDLLIEAEMPKEWIAQAKPMKAKGCDKCGATGYKGRKGIFEVLFLDEEIRNMIVKGSNADELKNVALEKGMLTLRQSGLMKLMRGETTLHEVLNNSRPDGGIRRK